MTSLFRRTAFAVTCLAIVFTFAGCGSSEPVVLEPDQDLKDLFRADAEATQKAMQAEDPKGFGKIQDDDAS
ncbi:MAG: hypothetical protein ACF8CQ_23890 [Rhodopirellula sp. JB044]|uniref:hypothetical protein n=1 Tax=Rhodopirellula sp. JB044 TaxID=3342844 RepID=UPI00370C96CF